MKDIIVQTSNLTRLLGAIGRLMNRGTGEEGMGLLYGRPGEGKTTAISYAVIQTRGVFLRASVTWSVTTMLQALCGELRIDAGRQRYPMMQAAVEALAMDPRPVFVDEADYLVRPGRKHTDMMDALRDVYDLSRSPIILIGMEDMGTRISPHGHWGRFHRRFTERVEFRGMTLVDAQRVAGALPEVAIEGALPEGARPGSVAAEGTLVESLYREADGNIGRLVVTLSEAERFAKANDLRSLDVTTWSRR